METDSAETKQRVKISCSSRVECVISSGDRREAREKEKRTKIGFQEGRCDHRWQGWQEAGSLSSSSSWT